MDGTEADEIEGDGSEACEADDKAETEAGS